VKQIVVLAFCLSALGCSSKLMEPKDIKEYEGNYIDTFVYSDLSSSVKSALKVIPDETVSFSGTLDFSVIHYKKDVLEWEGTETKIFYPIQKGITRIITKQFVNDFLNLTTYEMSYLGFAQVDVQSFKPGHRYFWSNHRMADLELIEADPQKGMHYKMEIGRRSQIADYWEREVKCETKGEAYEASTIHIKFKGQAIDFKCSMTADGDELLGVEEVAYLIDHHLYIPHESRNISGKYVYKIESVDFN